MSEAHTPPKLFVNKPKKGLQSPGTKPLCRMMQLAFILLAVHRPHTQTAAAAALFLVQVS
jgi:hypothetical protein